MADEENVNVAEVENNEVTEVIDVTDFQDTASSVNATDWQKFGHIATKILNYSSIVAAYLGVFAFLSYPILHVINYFCHIESFMKTLPLGYTMTITGMEDSQGFVTATFIIFGCLCVFIALKLGLWLIQKYSIASKICCILLGSGFLYLMIDKQANDILLLSLVAISFIIFMLFVGIPLIIIIHNTFLPFFRGLVPSVFTYYKFLFRFFPHTSALANLCEKKKKIVNKAEEKYKNRTIINAYNWSNNAITVECSDGNYFQLSGKLYGYTSNSVSVLIGKNWLHTYDAHGKPLGNRTIN